MLRECTSIAEETEHILKVIFRNLDFSGANKIYLNEWLKAFLPLIDNYKMDKLNFVFRLLDIDHDEQIGSEDLWEIKKNLIIKNSSTPHVLQALVDYYIEQNAFTGDVKRKRWLMMGNSFSISFREFLLMVDESYIIKVKIFINL